MEGKMKRMGQVAAAGLVLAVAFGGNAWAQSSPKVVIGMSGWTGFAPLTLAKEKGIFKANGVEVEIKKMPAQARHVAMAAGEVQAIATTVDTHITYVAANVPVTQVLVIDSSTGGDGVIVKDAIKSFADLKGKTVGVDNPGAVSYFWFAYLLKKNGLKMADMKTTNLGPQPAANAFAAGQVDAAVTYEPYMGGALKNTAGSKILVSSKDTPGVIIDTLAMQPDFIKKNPQVVRGITKSWFMALEWIKQNPAEANKIMGADVKQSGEDFAKSAALVTWYDKVQNANYFTYTLPGFMQETADILLEAGVIKKKPDLKVLADAGFLN
jgi:NitT/TauT family transport system substrate-binding protein